MPANSTALTPSAQAFSAAESANFPSKAAKSVSERPQAGSDWVDFEQTAFAYATEKLRRMPGCSQGDLAQAAKSYFYESLRAQGAADLFREPYVEAKAERMGQWWFDKHRRSQKRPHTKFGPESAALGRQRSQAKRTNKADVRACLAQLYQEQGDTMRAIAKKLSLGVGTVCEATKRDVSMLWRIVWAAVQFGKDSVQTYLQFEVPAQTALPNRTPDQAPRPKARDVDKIDIIGELLTHWEAEVRL